MAVSSTSLLPWLKDHIDNVLSQSLPTGIGLSACVYVCLSVCICMYNHMYVCAYVCLSTCMYVCPSMCIVYISFNPLMVSLTDEMEILSIDFNHCVPLLDSISVLHCTPGSQGNHDDSKCVAMVTDL